jgi:hypothetical protein
MIDAPMSSIPTQVHLGRQLGRDNSRPRRAFRRHFKFSPPISCYQSITLDPRLPNRHHCSCDHQRSTHLTSNERHQRHQSPTPLHRSLHHASFDSSSSQPFDLDSFPSSYSDELIPQPPPLLRRHPIELIPIPLRHQPSPFIHHVLPLPIDPCPLTIRRLAAHRRRDVLLDD